MCIDDNRRLFVLISPGHVSCYKIPESGADLVSLCDLSYSLLREDILRATQHREGKMDMLRIFPGGSDAAAVVAESGRLGRAELLAKRGSIGQMQTPAELVPIPESSVKAP